MIKGIVFDLDGTLIQLPINYQKIQKNLKEFFNISNDLKPLIPTIIKLSKNDQNKIKTSFDLICKEEILASDNFKIMNSALETLNFLKSKNLSLCLVTMQCKDALEKILQKLQIPDLFDSIISRDESFDRQKQIELSLKNIVLKPSEVLVIGDRIHDIESAKKIGCMPILKINEIEKIPPFQCKIIKNLIELKTIV
jgi:HAD superfamily hydrolase (TIGR01549 family)